MSIDGSRKDMSLTVDNCRWDSKGCKKWLYNRRQKICVLLPEGEALQHVKYVRE